MTTPERRGHMFGFHEASELDLGMFTLEEVKARGAACWRSLIKRGFAHIGESQDDFVRGYLDGWLFQEAVREQQYLLRERAVTS